MHVTQVQRSDVSIYKLYMQPYWLEDNAVYYKAQWPALISIADRKSCADA
jgi:hypothetical protein